MFELYPAMEIAPASGTSRPAIDLNKVVLPHPEGPKGENTLFEFETDVVQGVHILSNVLIRP